MENMNKDSKSLEELKVIEGENIAYVMTGIYNSVLENLFTTAFVAHNSKILENEKPFSVEEYLTNLRNLYTDIKSFQNGLTKLNLDKNSVVLKYEYFGESSNREVFSNYVRLIDRVVSLFELIKKTDRVLSNVNDKDEFMRIIKNYNNRFEINLDSIINIVNEIDDFGLGNNDSFVEACHSFNIYDYPELYGTETKSEQKVQPATNSEEKSVPSISKLEKERLAYIDKANELYDELVKDFMRDLEKQVPTSTYDLYKNFVDVRFANFVKRNPMPLDRTTITVGKAKDICRELNQMIDYISYISSQSYTIGKFSEKGE